MNRVWNVLWNVLRNILRFIFVTIPVWFYQNIIREIIRQSWSSFERFIRKNALWILFGGVFFLLAYFEQQEALHILFTIAILVFSLKFIFKGLGGKKKK